MFPLENEHTYMTDLTPSMTYDGVVPFAAWQSSARTRLAELVGLPYYRKAAAEVEILGEETYGDHREIRFTFQSEPGYRVPCVLCIPAAPCCARPPLVICLQGHSTGMHLSLGRPKYEEDIADLESGDRDFAVQCVARGFLALTVEQRCFGEAGGTPKPDCYRTAMAAIMAGRTLIGGRVWDVSRAIDVVTDRFSSYFDTDRIWCMGNSGGGTATLYAIALEPRIAGAICSCAFCGFLPSIVANYHCACNYVPGVRRFFDMAEIAALAAPKPLVIVNGKEDGIFPLGSASAEFARLTALYAAAGAPEGCAHVIGNGGHRFYAKDAWPVFLERVGLCDARPNIC